MPKVTGRDEVRRFIADLPRAAERVVRGAARAGANVLADEARSRVTSELVRDGITVRTSKRDTGILALVSVDGTWAQAVGTWLEWGTDPHFITVDDAQRAGRGIRRINQSVREADGAATLVIGGQPVGRTVFHPGARAHPFMRVSLDAREADAIREAQDYIAARVRPSGFVGIDDGDGA